MVSYAEVHENEKPELFAFQSNMIGMLHWALLPERQISAEWIQMRGWGRMTASDKAILRSKQPMMKKSVESQLIPSQRWSTPVRRTEWNVTSWTHRLQYCMQQRLSSYEVSCESVGVRIAITIKNKHSLMSGTVVLIITSIWPGTKDETSLGSSSNW